MQSDLAAAIDRLDGAEATAYRDMFAAAPAPLARSLGLEAREIAGATLLIAPGLPAPEFNRVVGLGNGGAVSDAQLDAVAQAYRAAGARTWWVQASPSEHAGGLIAQLTARGFAPPKRRAWVKMSRGAQRRAAVACGAEVRAARPEEHAALAEAVCAAFGMPAAIAPWLAALAARPGWRAAAAVLDGELVGGGFVHLQRERAWLGASGVRPAARGRHVHRALITLRIEQALEAGCTLITTETGEPIGDEPNPSLRNMQACGFGAAYSRFNYAAPS
jgi:GNAT superfamily N-acetyltransferase